MSSILRKSLSVFLTALILMLVSAAFCAAPVSAAQKIGLSKTSITLEVGQTASLKLNGTSGGKITWSMSNKKVAKYSKGTVTAVSEGTAYIYAKYNGKKYKCKVTVLPASEPEEDYIVNVKKGGSVYVYIYTDISDMTLEYSDQSICSVSGGALSDGSGYRLTLKGLKNGCTSFMVYDSFDPAVCLEFDVKVGSVSDKKVEFSFGGETVTWGNDGSSSWGGSSQTGSSSSDNSSKDAVDEVISLINKERAAEGLPALAKNDALCKNAALRADEISGYFSHTRPDGTECFTAISVPYGYAGENIAKGQRNASEVMDCWMNSSGHRKNILSPDYTSVGVGYDPSTQCWVQIFISE